LIEEAVLSECVQFAGAMISFVGILLGSHFFLLTLPGARDYERGSGAGD
jgi:hypothetical protein